MPGFSLEGFADDIFAAKTKEYFREVLSSYQNENYRSSVVMLWSVAVCDIIYKLEYLIDVYRDATATEIINEMTRIQAQEPFSSAWEIKLIEDTFSKTRLLDAPEYENLKFLQKQRHLSAHPVLTQERELHAPNRETVRSLLRNTLEGLLIKPPFYTQHILNEMLADLAEHRDALNDRHKVKAYVESRYLRRFKPTVETSIFKSLWKLTFKLENAECNANRRINLDVLEAISDRQAGRLEEIIRAEQEYFSNVAADGAPLRFFVYYLSKHPTLHALLSDAAKLRVQHGIATDSAAKIASWFVKTELSDHFADLLQWIESDDYPRLDDEQLKVMVEIEDSPEWQQWACKLLGAYYGASAGFNSADVRFASAIEPYLHLFDEDALIFTLERVERNRQTYGRGSARIDHMGVKSRLLAINHDFDFTPYPNFSRRLDAEE
ncbi:hypothetical protein QE393_002656 [Pseudomonas sp. SORGH_AS 211]|uniref:hypothetical protein n=1 Tax=Pseudomonas sp. SORGH_AS_0211 TaxID=3041796 RepID=UPI00285BD522|nr:hypothetical protein [Pseudomonas sp. SORGH_AS_0211]MDR6179396.1 hypothetical protein [Pseudomonas sp. SORGH_AS_0211]